jgi:CDP-paratose 2-epimerase
VPDRIWVTGGAGFVGSKLALALAAHHPHSLIVAIDNLRRRGSELNIPRLLDVGVKYVHADVRRIEDLSRITPPPDLIVECSAEPSVLAGYEGSPDYLVHTNLLGCFNCLEIARKVHADFIFISTSRVYPTERLNSLAFVETATRFQLANLQRVPGASEFGISEAFPLDGARSLYGMSKLAAELMVEEYGDAYGMRYVIDRCGLLTGPGQMAKADQGVIALWVAAHYFGKSLQYIGFGGTGKQVRDFLHIQDFCDLVLDQVRNLDLYAGKRWNIGGGTANSLSLFEATALCRQIVGKKIEITASLQNRPADVRVYLSDYRAVSAVNRWAPKRDAQQTLADIFDWIRADEKELRPVLGV